MTTLGRSWLVVTVLGYGLLVAGGLTVTQWTIGTEVVALLVVAARYDDLGRQR